MQFKIEYSPNFYEDLKNIRDYIAKDNPIRAQSFINELVDSIITLLVFPNAHKLLQDLFRKKLYKPFKYIIKNGYYIIYLIDNSTIKIYRAISAKQDIMQFIEFTNK